MRRLIEKYLKGECTEDEYSKVVTFIRDEHNEHYLNGILGGIWGQIVGKKSTIQPDRHLLDSIHHHIALKEQSQQSGSIRLYKQLLGVAAALIIVLVIHSLFFMSPSPPRNEIATQNITVPYGGKTHFMLPDGSSVWVNSGSTFSYPNHFGKERLVELQGEAYFDVVHQKSPFIVKSKFGEVEVHGTEFNVTAYNNEPFVTTLVKGSVVFTGNDGKRVRLKPRTQVIYDSGILKRKNVETKLFTSWKEGQLIFRDEPFKNIILRLERWYNVKILLKGDKIKNLKYTGTIEMETFSEVLELIKVTTPICYSFDKNTRVLTITSAK